MVNFLLLAQKGTVQAEVNVMHSPVWGFPLYAPTYTLMGF